MESAEVIMSFCMADGVPRTKIAITSFATKTSFPLNAKMFQLVAMALSVAETNTAVLEAWFVMTGFAVVL